MQPALADSFLNNSRPGAIRARNEDVETQGSVQRRRYFDTQMSGSISWGAFPVLSPMFKTMLTWVARGRDLKAGNSPGTPFRSDLA